MQAGKNINSHKRRRAFRLAYLNGALWSLGNGMASTSLIVYMARQLGAAGLGIGVILAAPHLVGSLRLVAPALVGRAGTRKNLCLAAFGSSAILLAAISQLAEPRQLSSPAMSLSVIVALWCSYHLLEYLGTVYLWAWLGDLTPRRIRGRFIGHRERWMLLTRIVGMLSSGSFASWWLFQSATNVADDWMAYAVPACFGAAAMMAALVPLARMPEMIASVPTMKVTRGDRWWQALADRNMRWLLLFGAWFSLANGLTQSAQYLFPIAVFGLSLFARQSLEGSMRFVQSLSSSGVGALADRFGNRRVLIAAQLLVALAPLALLAASLASPDEPSVYHDGSHWWNYQSWWLHGGLWLCTAWLFWIAYVGLNVGLPNLMLKLAGPGRRASYIAWYFALTGVVYGLCTIAGGALYSYLERTKPEVDLPFISLDHNELLFLAGFVLRASAVICLLPIVETVKLRRENKRVGESLPQTPTTQPGCGLG
jgi:MFS family permease